MKRKVLKIVGMAIVCYIILFGIMLKSTKVEAAVTNYETKMNLETPQNGVQSSKQLYLKGWVMTNAPNYTIKVYLNEEEVGTITNRVARQDVLNAISGAGGASKNPKPGYAQTIDVSSYPSGAYVLGLKVISTSDNTILEQTTRNIYLQTYPTTMNMETPQNGQNVTANMTVKGWVMSENANAQIKIAIDGQEIKTVSNRVIRADVLNAITGYGGSKKNPKPGYQEMIDLSSYADGSHTITLKVIDPETQEILETTTRTIYLTKYPTTMNLETPQPDTYITATSMTVKGWVMSENANAQIKIAINGEEVKTVTNRIARQDVLNAIQGYGGTSANPKPGYQETIDVSHLKDGLHTLTLKVVNPQTGEELISTTRRFTLKKYSALFNIEEPSKSEIYTKSINISGWVMSKAPNTTLKIYMDNQEMTQTIQRTQRADVINAYGASFGGITTNPTPGFQIAKLDLSNYTEGYHTIRVELWNTSMNEVIGSVQKRIQITSNILYGIDVSHHQGVIDWAKVKEDGVEFAILRAGYRGWGTSDDGVNGKLAKDTRFDYNATQAIKNGIPIGVYFFSQAINEQEAIEEAKFMIEIIKNYSVTYPVVIDVEYSGAPNNTGRADNVSKEMRTKICIAFAETIKAAGYEPMIYADKYFASTNLDMTKLSSYKFWLAHYTGATQENPLEKPSDYTGKYQMWQYTSSGKINGIATNVDLNIFYIGDVS